MRNPYLSLLSALLLAFLSACGGGAGGGISIATSGGSGGGIGGTGLTSSGTIDGFGSVFVNGIEFETGAAEILVDGQSLGEDALGLGMVVLVTGEVNDDGVTGTASRIVFDDEVQGPVQAVQQDQDGDSLLITVLGLEVIVERTGTVFAGVRFDSLKLGDLVEISGFANADGRLRATRVEKVEDFVSGASQVDCKGVVAGLAGTEFTLREFTVDFSTADLSEVPGGMLVAGMQVEVSGTLDAESMRISAARIEQEEGAGIAFGNDEDATVQGLIAGFVSRSDFRVNGVDVNAGAASLNPAELVLGDGVVVEVEGIWADGVLRANRVEGRRGRVEIEATVTAVSSADNSLTLQLHGTTVTVLVNSRTMLDDDTGSVERFAFADIGAGDFLEVEALRVGESLVATRIDRDDPDEDVLQARVESFTPGNTITMLGVTFSTVGAGFETQDDVQLDSDLFYAALETGMLVKVKDEQPADGVAEKVEFEFEGALDGELEFDDDEDESDEIDGTDEVDEVDEPEDPGEPEDPDEPEDPESP